MIRWFKTNNRFYHSSYYRVDTKEPQYFTTHKRLDAPAERTERFGTGGLEQTLAHKVGGDPWWVEVYPIDPDLLVMDGL